MNETSNNETNSQNVSSNNEKPNEEKKKVLRHTKTTSINTEVKLRLRPRKSTGSNNTPVPESPRTISTTTDIAMRRSQGTSTMPNISQPSKFSFESLARQLKQNIKQQENLAKQRREGYLNPNRSGNINSDIPSREESQIPKPRRKSQADKLYEDIKKNNPRNVTFRRDSLYLRKVQMSKKDIYLTFEEEEIYHMDDDKERYTRYYKNQLYDKEQARDPEILISKAELRRMIQEDKKKRKSSRGRSLNEDRRESNASERTIDLSTGSDRTPRDSFDATLTETVVEKKYSVLKCSRNWRAQLEDLHLRDDIEQNKYDPYEWKQVLYFQKIIEKKKHLNI